MAHPTTWVSGGTDYPQVELLDADYNSIGDAYDIKLQIPIIFINNRCYLKEDWPQDREGRDYKNATYGQIEGGFSWTFELRWPAITADSLRVLVGFDNHQADEGFFKLWPHKDIDRWIIAKLVTCEIGEYLKGQYVGYGPNRLVFRSVVRFPRRYHETKHYYFTDPAEGGYSASEITHFTDPAGAYGPAEPICLFDGSGIVYDPVGRMVAYDT